MNKEQIKNAILGRKFSILLAITLLVIVGVLFSKIQQEKYNLLYQYQAIPDIELMNTLNETPRGLSGEVSGFVRFDDPNDQPKDTRQYYIIKALNQFDENSSQYFSSEEIVKMSYLSPRSLGVSELIETNETSQMITLEDGNGNQFFINRMTKEITTGDDATLISSESDYRDFVIESFKK